MNWKLVLAVATASLSLARTAYCSALATSSLPLQVSPSSLVSLRSIDGLSLSPDGRQSAFRVIVPNIQDNSYSTEWYAVDVNKASPPADLGDGGDPGSFMMMGGIAPGGLSKAPPGRWSTDLKWFAHVVGEDGEQGLAIAGAGGSKLLPIDGDASNFEWLPDQPRLCVRVDQNRLRAQAALKREALSGYLFDERFIPFIGSQPILGKEEARFPEAAKIEIFDTSGNRIENPSPILSKSCSGLVSPPPASGGWIRAGTYTVAARPSKINLTASSDGRRQAWLETTGNEFYRRTSVVEVSTNGRAGIQKCGAAECTGEIRNIWLLEDGQILFLRGEGPQGERIGLYKWEPGKAGVRKLLNTSDLLTGCQVAADTMVCVRETLRSPKVVVRIDLADGAISTLFDPNPMFHGGDSARISRIDVDVGRGETSFAYLALPSSSSGHDHLPLIITPSFCKGMLSGAGGDEYPFYALVSEGFAVLCLNNPTFREWYLGDDWQIPERQMDAERVQQRWYVNTYDNLVELLARKGAIDPDRVGVTGISHGSEIAYWALTHMKHLAAVSVSSPNALEPEDYYLGEKDILDPFYGLEDPFTQGLEKWRESSIALNLGRVHAPLLYNAADIEYLAGIQTIYALQAAKRPVEMYIFPNEGHGKTQPIHMVAVAQRNVDWFNFWLRGREDRDPAKRDQYARWEHLCDLQKSQNPSRPAFCIAGKSH